MKIAVKNLGAIKQAEIDLGKKLNVFCGPNGTGKTYLAYLIYSITSLNNKSLGRILEKEYINQLVSTNTTSIEIEVNKLWNYREEEVQTIKENLWNLFAVAENKSEKFFSKTEIQILDTFETFESQFTEMNFKKEIKLYGYKFIISKIKKTHNINITLDENQIKVQDFLRFLEIALLSRVYSILAFYPIVSSTIFPVERNSIYTFSEELSIRNNDRYEMIKELSSKKDINPMDLFFKPNTRYPQPIRDGLRVAENLENTQKLSSPYYDFATEIEKELLNGKVTVTNEGNVEFSSDKAPRVKLSFHQSSSIVKTLSSLVIYLKHLATKDDLVIIDEPELNLHPDNQIKLTRIFARLINQGIRLVISTHSDYIVREINNLIMVSSTDENPELVDLAKEMGYEKDEYLKLDDFKAYLFKYKNASAKQTEVVPIKCDKNGFDVETLDKTIEDLNDRSNQLFYALKYGKDYE